MSGCPAGVLQIGEKAELTSEMKGEIGKIEDGGRVCKKRGEAG
jgi:hypothetical protein